MGSILVINHLLFFFPIHSSLTNIKLLIILKSEKLLNGNLIHYSSDSDVDDVFSCTVNTLSKACGTFSFLLRVS